MSQKHSYNKSNCKGGSGQCVIMYEQASVAVRAQCSIFSFSSQLNNIFSIGICIGQTSNEFTAFANT